MCCVCACVGLGLGVVWCGRLDGYRVVLLVGSVDPFDGVGRQRWMAWWCGSRYPTTTTPPPPSSSSCVAWVAVVVICLVVSHA